MRSRKRDDTRLVPVKRRRIIHISGFEPIEPAVLTRRLSSGLKHFAPIWGATATRSDAVMSEDGRVITWDVTAHGPNWSTDTQYTILRWDDLMAPYVGQPWLRRIVAGYAALFEFARTGTIGRYFKANVRYGLFVIYPVLVLVACLILAVVAGLVAVLAGIPLPRAQRAAFGARVFVLLMRVLGNVFYLDFALVRLELRRRSRAPGRCRSRAVPRALCRCRRHKRAVGRGRRGARLGRQPRRGDDGGGAGARLCCGSGFLPAE